MAGPLVSFADHSSGHDPSRFAVASQARRGDPRADDHVREASMSRYTATLGFTLVAIWIAVVFILVSGTTG